MHFKVMIASICGSQAKSEKNFLHFTTLTSTLVIASVNQSAIAHQDTKDIIQVTKPRLNIETIAVAEKIDVIDAQSPELQSSSTAFDLLKGQAGIFVSGAGSTYGQSIQMRGYDNRGVKITVDNISQDFNSGLFDATFVDPTLIKKVYVHKGSGSLHHGGGALAGVIALKTINASDLLKPNQKIGGKLTSGINRNNHSYLAGVSLYGRTEQLDGLFSYSQRKKQLEDSFTARAARNLNHDENIRNWMAKATWFAHPKYQIELQLKDYRNDSITLKRPTITADMSRYGNSPHRRKSRQWDIIVNQKIELNNNLNWQGNWDAYYSNLTLKQLDLVKVKNTFNKYSTEHRKQFHFGTTVSNHFNLPINAWANQLIQSGFSYSQEQRKSNEYATSFPPTQLSNTSIWLADDLTLTHLPVTFSVGTRFTSYQASRDNFAKNQHTNWSSRFAVSMTPTYWLTINASYSEGYRTPRMSEIYNDSLHFKNFMISSDFLPNLNLKPEKNQTTELGLNLSFDDIILAGSTLQMGVQYFNTKATDHIVIFGKYKYLLDVIYPKTLYYINIPRASIYGVDGFLQYQTHWFDLNVNYNKTIGQEDDTNYSLSSIRPETLTVRFNAPISTTGLSLGWTSEFSAKTAFDGSVETTTNTVKNRYKKEIIQYAGYSTHDFYVSYNADRFIDGLSSTLMLKNVFDKDYVSSMGVPREGRNFYFNVNYKW
ncbi:TonB-dependent receptor domain-containing protein [Providencia sp. Me31A]|uniref:TonB-dependent receptor domain-containing protein n=1 Tax=Providencia sp. Me31A TaxID=3392637 RepID=UPI003D27ADEB